MLLDTMHILKIVCELNVVPLALQITTICGNIMVGGLMPASKATPSALCADLFFFQCMLLLLFPSSLKSNPFEIQFIK